LNRQSEQQQSALRVILRRIATIIYDLFLVLAVLFVLTAVAVAINDGERVHHPIYYLCLLVVVMMFYIGFWRYGGQTLGMRAWRYRLTSAAGGQPGLQSCFLRLILAAVTLLPAGVGLLWILFDPQQLTLYDKLSSTRLRRTDLSD